jgi:hypothetical protein
MKIRIKGNSLRLRLTKSEVEEFARSQRFEEKICFGKNTDECLTYALEKSSEKQVSATFTKGRITVFVPEATAQNWVKTDQVGFEAEQKIDNQNVLRILVEKDFACLTPRKNEDESDNYPHPKENQAC